LGGSQFENCLGGKLARPFSINEPDMKVHLCNASYTGGRGKRIKVQSRLWTPNMRTYMKNK
jgi:hypothetical protein